MKNHKIYFIPAIFFFILFLTSPSEGKTRFFTSLNVSEEYNDNINYQTEDEDNIDTFVTITNPSLFVEYLSSRTFLTADYGFYYTHYENSDARKMRSKYHHSGNLNMNMQLTSCLVFELSSSQKYSDAVSLVDIDHELIKKEKLFRSYNNSSLTYTYGPRRNVGLIYTYRYFKYFGDEVSTREKNNAQLTGGYIHHAFSDRNLVGADYSFQFGKYFTDDGQTYIGKQRLHTGDFFYQYRINRILSTSLSYIVTYREYPFEIEDSEFESKKYFQHEVRNTIQYDITEILKSSYWIGFNSSKKEIRDLEDKSKNLTGGLNFVLTLKYLKVNADSGYEVRENLYYTLRERLGEYKSYYGGISTTIGSRKNPLNLRLYLNGRNNRYETTKTTGGEFRKEKVYYFGGDLNYTPLTWVYMTIGYHHVFRESNEKEEVYDYTNNRVYLKLTITLPSRRT